MKYSSAALERPLLVPQACLLTVMTLQQLATVRRKNNICQKQQHCSSSASITFPQVQLPRDWPVLAGGQ